MPERTLYLHVGTHKTGTTALQNFFAANRDILKTNNIIYPYDAVGGGEAGHFRLPWSIQAEDGEYRPKFPQDLKNSNEEWGYVLSQSKGCNCLVSTEGFWKCNREQIRRIRGLTAGFQVKVIVYLRRQDSMLVSLYNQTIKGSRRVFPESDQIPQAPYDLDYLININKWAEAFGKKNIILRPYEVGQFVRGNIFADFLEHVFGLTLTEDFEIPTSEANPGLHRVVLEYKHKLNYLALTPDQISEIVISLVELSKIFYKKGAEDQALLSPQQRLDIIQKYAPVNEQIAREYLGRKDGSLFYDPPPDTQDNPRSLEILLEEEIYTINSFLRDNYPEVFNVIRRAVKNAKYSGNINLREIALLLANGLSFDPVTQYKQSFNIKFKKNVFLHIGDAKTGTSALQFFLCQNREVLEHKGFSYPGHTFDENNVSSGNAQHLAMDIDFEDYSDLCETAGQILDVNNENVLLSCEHFSNYEKESILRLKALLPETVKVIVYLRRQDLAFISGYNQRIKRHGLKTPSLRKIGTDPLVALTPPIKKRLCYIQMLTIWGSVFGNKNIIVRPYEKKQFKGGTIFSDFLHILGLEMTDEYELPEKTINPSYIQDALEFKRLVNCLDVEGNPFDFPLQKYSESNSEQDKRPFCILCPTERSHIIGAFAESNTEVAKKYLGREDGRLFYEPQPDPDEPWEPYPGLSKDKVKKIGLFLVHINPELIATFGKAVVAGLRSKNQDVQNVALILKPALELFIKDCIVPLSFLVERYKKEIVHQQKEIVHQQKEIVHQQKEIELQQKEIERIISSKSWRYTSLIRKLKRPFGP